MRILGQSGIWIAFLLMVLAGTSWAGFILVRPLYFFIPATLIFMAVAIAAFVPRPDKHATQRPH